MTPGKDATTPRPPNQELNQVNQGKPRTDQIRTARSGSALVSDSDLGTGKEKDPGANIPAPAKRSETPGLRPGAFSFSPAQTQKNGK